MKSKKKQLIFIILFITFFCVFSLYYLNLQADKKVCLQNINYYSEKSFYLIEYKDSGRVYKENGKIAVFRTKKDAMEFCLLFIE